MSHIDQHRQQQLATKKLQERIAYLHTLDDGQLIHLFQSICEEMSIRRFKHELDQLEVLMKDIDLVEHEVYGRMAERRTTHFSLEAY